MSVYRYIIFFLLLSLGAKAQQNYFIYVQADNKQPFIVKVSDKVLTSSASGYIVIPKLSTGSYSLTIGFPKDIYPQQTLALTVANTDAGYLLKNYGEKGWGLYNIQTTELTMNGGPPQRIGNEDDAFTSVLSGAANTVFTPRANVSVEKTAPTVNTEKTELPVTSRRSLIEKLSSTISDEGSVLIYTDRTGASVDTVRVFIPASPAVVVKKQVTNTTSITKEPAKEARFIDITLQNPNIIEGETAKTTDKPIVSINSDCRANAGDDDFIKIRKKMAAAADEDAMVDAAGKFFKAKCYSTDQVKNLSTLFLTDAGKYKFFDAAYPHTLDTQNFASLQSQLNDQYYIKRFRAMVRN